MLACLAAAVALTAIDANADSNFSIGAGVGTTGMGLDAEWRPHGNFGVIASYYGGISYNDDDSYSSDGISYRGDLDISAGALKLAYHPFGGSFFLAAGAMLPDMTADVTGIAENGRSYEFNGSEYSADAIGTMHGTLTIADSVQPYFGLGWRSSNETGFGMYSELGVMTTDINVSLHSSNGHENQSQVLRDELRAEEKRLEDEADKLELYPVAQLGISYTF